MNIHQTLMQIDRAFIDIGHYREGMKVETLPNVAVLLDCALEELEPSTPKRTVMRLNEQVFHAWQLFSNIHLQTYITDLYVPDWADGFCIDLLTLRHNPNGRCTQEEEQALFIDSLHPYYARIHTQERAIEQSLIEHGRYLWHQQSFYLTHVQRTGALLSDAVLRRARRLALSIPPFYERLEGWRPTNGLFMDYVEKLMQRYSLGSDVETEYIPSNVVRLLWHANANRVEREGRKRLKYWVDVSIEELSRCLNNPSLLGRITPLRTNKWYDLLKGVSHTIVSPEQRREWVKLAEAALRGVRLSQHSFRSDGTDEEDRMKQLFQY